MRVFISHSSKDKEIATNINDLLNSHGFKTWIDEEKINGGDNFTEKISDALEYSDIFVLLWSESASQSKFVKTEWTFAVAKHKKIIPCLIDNSKLPPIISNIHHINLSNYIEGESKLLKALKANIKGNKKSQNKNSKYNSQRVSSQTTNVRNKIMATAILLLLIILIILKHLYYPSHIILRNKKVLLTEEEAKRMILKLDFFDTYRNTKGKGFDNHYKLEIINNDIVILDNNSKLMWQQGGSLDDMNYTEAEKWIKQLNQKGFAGYHDWRLPTLEEAMTLVESEKMNDGLFINPHFNKAQFSIWTADIFGHQGAWGVFFNQGRCRFSINHNLYVRAVRSLDNN